ncbi:PH domain-containing protein [Acinetobacter johnsonii]|jgi:hypothetical protein|uniref:PH domain-containing protein n=1 Tax=Acinetobacter TaxID=469 RepID=UPI00159654F8|nr:MULTISPECIES: PH domain-containing protein [Acinetobacter]QKY89576.1 PH domain-containing protein [Acinetobacter sp. NEB 394]UIZ99728.1 hypothetical protein GBN93_01490 [Acinetobacter johnsonii]
MQKFRSKMDWWFLGFIIAMSGLLAQLILTTYGKGILMQNLLFVVVYALTIVLLWWPLWSTRYVVDQEQLTIRSLCFKWIIPLSAIQSVSETDNSISSPALSLDRLKIEYLKQGQTKTILVSPKDKVAFKAALKLS